MDILCRPNFCSWEGCAERVAKKCFLIKSFFAVFCCKFRLEIRGKQLGFCLLQLFINFPIWMFYRMEVIGRRAINGAFRWLRWWSSGNWPIRRSVGADSCHTIPHLTKPNHIIQYHTRLYQTKIWMLDDCHGGATLDSPQITVRSETGKNNVQEHAKRWSFSNNCQKLWRSCQKMVILK